MKNILILGITILISIASIVIAFFMGEILRILASRKKRREELQEIRKKGFFGSIKSKLAAY